MTDNIKNGPIRTLTHIVGHDSSGKGGLQAVGNVLAQNNQFALIGDSRAAADFVNSTATEVFQNVSGFGYWLQCLTKGCVTFPQSENFAVAGYTTGDVVTNGKHTLAAASTAKNVLGIVEINDRATGSGIDAATTIANLTTIIQALIDAGKRVFWITATPKGDSTFTAVRLSNGTPNQLRYQNQVRDWQLHKAPDLFGPNYIPIDAWSAIASRGSATGDAILGETYDGLHQGPRGAFHIASLIVDHIKGLYPVRSLLSSSATDVYDATYNPRGNMLPNGQMTGVAGTLTTDVTGDLADSTTAITANWSGMTAVCSKVTTDTGDWQQVHITGTATSNVILQFRQQLASMSVVATNDVVAGMGEWEVDASSTGLRAFGLSVERRNSGTLVSRSRSGGSNGSGPWPAEATSGIWPSPSQQTITGAENQLQAYVNIDFINGATVDVTLRFRNLSIKKVI